jgi:hypothetical protein
LREDVNFASRRIKGLLEGDLKALLFCPRPVPGEIETFLNESIDVDRSMLARAFTRVRIGPIISRVTRSETNKRRQREKYCKLLRTEIREHF